MTDVPEKAVDAALNAHAAWQREARQAVWTSPSREQVRRMIAAAVPFTITADRERIAASLHCLAVDESGRSGVPGVERDAKRDAFLAAAEVALLGGLSEEHGEEKEPQP